MVKKNDMKKIQIFVFINGNTISTDVMSHIIVRHIQTSHPRYPISCVGSTHYPIRKIQTHSRESL